MTTDFTPGQELPGFKLLQALDLDAQFDNWLAVDTQHNERVWCKRLPVALGAAEQTIMHTAISRHRGLIHPNILRTLDLVHWRGADILICQHIDSLRVFSLQQSFHGAWPILRQLLEVLDYAHSINLAHGDIRPGNLLIDRQQQLHLAGFGLRVKAPVGSDDLASPQVLAGQPATVSDDIYALGALLDRLLSPPAGQPAVMNHADGAMSDAVKSLVESMLATSASARPEKISIIRSNLQAYYDAQISHQVQQPAAPDSNQKKPAQQPESTQHAPGTFDQEAEFDTQVHPGPPQKSAVSVATALAALSALILIAGTMFFVLPTALDESAGSFSELTIKTNTQTDFSTLDTELSIADAPIAGAPIADAPIADASIADAPNEPAIQIDPGKSSAEALAETLLRQQVELEDQGVQIWATAEYSLISTQARMAEDLFRKDLYAAALVQYQQAISASQALAARIPDLIIHNQKIAADAFTQGHAELATKALSTLIAMRPDIAKYRSDLIRAENLDQVLEWLRQAQSAEREQAWMDALALYQQAQTLDTASLEARTGVMRTTEVLARLRFNEAMSLALMRLEQADLTGARQAFSTAQAMRPMAPEPEAGLLQIRLLEQSQRINTLSLQAEQAMADEAWSMAIVHLEQVLELEPGLLSANASLEQARQRRTLDQTLNVYLKAPERMRLDPELTMARQALIRAAGLASQGPLLQRQISDLSLLIAQARIPLPVVVLSDNNTDITIYQTSHLGAFMKHELALVPGTYTMVGRRPGYRDVRQQFTLSGGMAPVTIHLTCDEKI